MEESKIYRLEEMIDAMAQDKKNAEDVIFQQKELIDVILKSDKAEKFSEFISSMKEQIDNIVNQIKQLDEKSEALKQIVEECKKSDDCAKGVDLLIFATGMFK